MDKETLWSTVEAERRALAADLEGIDPAAWDRDSLCEGWSVRDVVAHLVATARITPASFLPKLAGSGFSFKRMQAKDISAVRGPAPADTLAALRGVESVRKGPPGPPTTNLGETVVHAEDVRRPLGIRRDYPAAALAEVAEFYAGSNLIIGGKKRVAGLKLRATDQEWSHGDGPEVAGPTLALTMATAGRGRAYRDELSGPGVETLLSRA